MCITSTARRRLNVHLLPSHLLALSVKQRGSPLTVTQPSSSFSLQQKAGALLQSYSHPPYAIDTHQEVPHPQVVQHDYHDHSADPTVDPSQIKHKAKGGVITPFPVKLHEMLDRIEADGLAHVVSWQPHGRCFAVHKPSEFVDHVMPKYFKQTKMASFQRQLNLYGFNRLTGGLDKGGYYHELFLRGKVSLAYDIKRMRVKGTGVRLPTNPDNEPNFYALPPVTVAPIKALKSATLPSLSQPNATKQLPSSMAIVSPPSTGSPINSSALMTQRRAELQLESLNHSKKVAAATALSASAITGAAGPSSSADSKKEDDILFFEGCPFHFLDPSSLAPSVARTKSAPTPKAQTSSQPSLPLSAPTSQSADPVAANRPALVHSASTVVSDSEDDGDNLVPSFSVSNMDWEGPLSSPSLQAHMRRTSFQSFTKGQKVLDSEVETFFQDYEMPIERWHNQIEQMSENDDTAFGYLLEEAISE